jgi:hypothetical protein
MFYNKNSSKMNTFIIIVIIILIICFVSILITKFKSNKPSNEYEIMMPLQGDAKHMNLCPTGCSLGVCKKGSGQCKYDFQCEYCSDKNTNTFYVEFDNDREILPLYEEEKKMNNSQKNTLNDMIKTNNDYIGELNKKIVMMNNDINGNMTKYNNSTLSSSFTSSATPVSSSVLRKS